MSSRQDALCGFRGRRQDAAPKSCNPVAHGIVAFVQRGHPIEVPSRIHLEIMPLQ